MYSDESGPELIKQLQVMENDPSWPLLVTVKHKSIVPDERGDLFLSSFYRSIHWFIIIIILLLLIIIIIRGYSKSNNRMDWPFKWTS